MKTHPVQINEKGSGVSLKLAEFVAGTSYASLPGSVIHQFKRTLIDYLCVTIAGSTRDVSRKTLDYFSSIDRSDTCTAVGSATRLSAPNASFVNGTSAHALDFDDGHTASSIHQGAIIYPAVLAGFEQHHAELERVVLGAVIGQEVAIRIGMAGHPATWRRGFHNTGIVGPFGAAAGVSKILGLGVEATLNALGIAGSHAAGLFEFLSSGADTKRLHPGRASRDGLVCAELAARGITGPPTVLEGAMGYFKAYAGEQARLDRVTDGLGARWEMLRSYTKPYPCCRHLHAPIDVLLALRQETAVKPEEVESMTIFTYTTASRHNAQVARTVLEAQMSIPCAVSLALKHGQVTVDLFASEAFLDPEVVELMKRISIQVDDVSDTHFPQKRITTLQLRTRDGRVFQKRIDNPRGSEDSALTDEEMGDKFTQTCAPVLGRERCDRILSGIWSLDNSKSLKEILVLCTR